MRRLEQPAVRSDGLQLEDHRSYQEKLWTVERCAWVLFIAITLGAAAGITGAGGVLSRQAVAIDGGEIDHPRIARWETAEEMTVRFAPGSGPRTLLLIVAETTQQALLGDDFSITNATILIITLFTIDIALSYVKQWLPRIGLLIDGTPTVLICDGKPDERALARARVSIEEVLATAREQQGLERLDQIKFAILEAGSGISVVPKR